MTSQSGSQVTIMQTQTSTPIPHPKIGYPQKFQMTGAAGPHSKRSLAFGITCLGICAIGGILSLISLLPLSFYYYSPIHNYSGTFIGFIIRALILTAGLVFSILARSNGNKAEEFESSNGMQKAGKIMGLLGVIFSALLIGNFVLLDNFLIFISGLPSYPL